MSSDRPTSMEVTFAYLGAGEVEEVTHAVTDEWIENARHHLESLVPKMTGETFAPVPGVGCTHCDFVAFCDAGATFLAERTADEN